MIAVYNTAFNPAASGRGIKNHNKIKWAEDLSLEIISFKSKYEGVKNGRSKRIEQTGRAEK